MTDCEPTRERTRHLREHLSAERWQARVEQAVERARVVEQFREHLAGSDLSRAAVRAVAPGVAWTTARRWWRWYVTREGEPWERMMDWRWPSRPWKTPAMWEAAVQTLGRQDPQPHLSQIRDALVAQFGPEARLCDNTLKRILLEVDLWTPYSRRGRAVEKVTELNGGGALVVLLAASIETEAPKRVAEKVAALAKAQQSPKRALPEEPAGRDERGRFTAQYNDKRLEMLEELGCSFYRPAEELREGKDLSRLRLAKLSASTLEQHLRCIMALPLITERRGTVGLDGPAGAWLQILSPVAYMAATVDKTLCELKALGAAETMWESHARTWLGLSEKWAGESWRQLVDYVDVTYDPWWTQRFAMSGKVSRTGRVQPCLARALLSSGPGVPIIAHVVSGTAPLKDHLFSMLELADELRGEDSLGRFTVVDAECCTIEMLRHFSQDPKRDIITVLKGSLAQGKSLEQTGQWVPFRRRDQLREGLVNLEPNKADGLKIRVVEMVRTSSRHPKPTWFATTGSKQQLCTEDVAQAYLSRWPFQEDLFRRARNGAGLERSHGYGVFKVENVAVIGKREQAGRKLCTVTLEVMQAEQAEAKAARQLEEAQARLRQRQADIQGDSLNGRHRLGVRLAKRRVKDRQRQLKQARRKQKKAADEYQAQQSIPDEIYVRDTELDAAATCIKMMLLATLEFICQEYLARRRITPRTFIEAWLPSPVTIRERPREVVYEVAPNPRDPEMTALLAQALARITERKLEVDGRRLVARIRDGPS